MSDLRITPIHRALYRPNLIMGGERELVLTAILVAVALAVTAMNIVSAVVGLFVWVLSITGLRMMAKADPQMSWVWVRFMKYQKYYAARSRPFRT